MAIGQEFPNVHVRHLLQERGCRLTDWIGTGCRPQRHPTALGAIECRVHHRRRRVSLGRRDQARLHLLPLHDWVHQGLAQPDTIDPRVSCLPLRFEKVQG